MSSSSESDLLMIFFRLELLAILYLEIMSVNMTASLLNKFTNCAACPAYPLFHCLHLVLIV
jgi:hypothetical protein